jgi:hypothetical protein
MRKARVFKGIAMSAIRKRYKKECALIEGKLDEASVNGEFACSCMVECDDCTADVIVDHFRRRGFGVWHVRGAVAGLREMHLNW